MVSSPLKKLPKEVYQSCLKIQGSIEKKTPENPKRINIKGGILEFKRKIEVYLFFIAVIFMWFLIFVVVLSEIKH